MLSAIPVFLVSPYACLPTADEQKLFAPFPEPIVELRAEDITQMLRSQPTVRLSSDMGSAVICPLLLQGCVSQTYSVLAIRITNALNQTLPDQYSSEVVWSGFWDNLLTSIFAAAEQLCAIGLRVDRDVQDATITVEGKRRDFYLFLHGRTIVHGEDKPQKVGLQAAIQDLRQKHKESSPYIYGRLTFCIGFATGAKCLVDGVVMRETATVTETETERNIEARFFRSIALQFSIHVTNRVPFFVGLLLSLMCMFDDE